MTGDRKAPSLFVREPQLVEKVCFFKKSACSQSLSPNPFPRERGYITGATAPRPCRGLRPCDPIYIIKRFIDSLKDVTLSVTSLSYIRLFGVFACRRKCDGTFDTLFLKLAGQLVGLLYIALIDKAVCVTAA